MVCSFTICQILDDYCEDLTQDTIGAAGKVQDSQIAVCKRPDRRGMSHQKAQMMAYKVADNIRKKTRR